MERDQAQQSALEQGKSNTTAMIGWPTRIDSSSQRYQPNSGSGGLARIDLRQASDLMATWVGFECAQ
jgi:hypothetical protein